MRFYSIYVNENDRQMSNDYIKTILNDVTFFDKLIGPLYFMNRNMFKSLFLFLSIEAILIALGMNLMRFTGVNLFYWILSIHFFFSWIYFYIEMLTLENNGYVLKQIIFAKDDQEAIYKYLSRFNI